MDGYYRSGKLIDHKANADIAAAVAEQNGQKLDKILVWRRLRDKSAISTPMVPGRDYDLPEVMKGFAAYKWPNYKKWTHRVRHAEPLVIKPREEADRPTRLGRPTLPAPPAPGA